MIPVLVRLDTYAHIRNKWPSISTNCMKIVCIHITELQHAVFYTVTL
uniref:Uncharacterized protein n=1 Tax=Anguilla anguilla TaxID=7936 RepID=A0A0E9XBH7_ANGAN